jgi:OmpA-OmpF porin, OOP family
MGKGRMKTKLVLLFGALALAGSSAAVAQSNDFYGGVGLGRAKANLNRADFTFNQVGIQENRNEIDTAYKFFGGYQFSRNIAAELSYTDFGKFAYIYNASALGAGEERLNYKATSVALSAVGTIPIRSGFSALARLGIAYNHAERSAFTGDPATVLLTSPRPSASKYTTSLLWGFGGQYDFSPALTMRLEYEDFGKFGDATSPFPNNVQTGRAKIHLLSLNFIVRF